MSARKRAARPGPKRPRRFRGRHLHSMVLAGATTLFVPHAGKIVPKSRQSTQPIPTSIGRIAELSVIPGTVHVDTSIHGTVSVETSFRLPPDVSYEPLIEEAAERYDVNPALIRAVIAAESAFDPWAVSRAGAQGLMQLMPALAEELGVLNAFDPRENIMAGTRYLGELLRLHRGDVQLALASYNAGPGAVLRYSGIPPYRETQQYVKTITDILEENN